MLVQKYPRMSIYLADSMSHYYDIEPHSTFVDLAEAQIVGTLRGTLDIEVNEQAFRKRIRTLLVKRTLLGKYGWPAFLLSILKTHLTSPRINAPCVEPGRYPAHLHIGLIPDWRRQGIGTALMSEFERYLQQKNVPGYHLYASSFHPMGVAFYRKLGLIEIGSFQWRFHNRAEWLVVTETIFGKTL
jgi:GNAT superfamily N-acetyltransferase